MMSSLGSGSRSLGSLVPSYQSSSETDLNVPALVKGLERWQGRGPVEGSGIRV